MTPPDPLYAAWSAIGRPIPAVAEVLARAADRHARLGLAAIPELVEASGQAAARFATLVGASPGTVARTGSTSEGLTAIALSTDWQPNDRVVLFRGEFPSNRTPWLQAADTFGLTVVEVDVDAFEDPQAGLSALDDALADGARLVAVSAVQFHTGLRMPTAEIARRAHGAGAQIVVDAIQAAGIVPIDVQDGAIDWLVVGGHKWLGCPVGTGFVYGRHDAWAATVPRTASWLSHPDPMAFLTAADARPDEAAVQPGPARFEGGMRNHPGLAASVPALDALIARDLPAELTRLHGLHDGIEAALVERGFSSRRAQHPEGRSGILSLVPPAGLAGADLVHALAHHGVVATAPDGLLRLAPGHDAPDDTARRVVTAVDRALADLR